MTHSVNFNVQVDFNLDLDKNYNMNVVLEALRRAINPDYNKRDGLVIERVEISDPDCGTMIEKCSPSYISQYYE